MSRAPRLRPRLHFTARQGWTNDPHGVVYLDGRYHMFFQYNPGGVTWSPACHWGHAVSSDLIVWNEVDVALSPAAGEVGCWSGSAVIDDRGPVIAYTRIVAGDWAMGQVALARPRNGMLDWVREPARAVIGGPPAGLDVVAFRDPQVRRENGRWKAVIGAGLAGSGGCALQYSSARLEEWTFDGVLAARAHDERAPACTGTVWECPQFLQVGGDWVMIMSAWSDGSPDRVHYAVGDYDGRATFTARRYGPFSHGSELYATTTFRDAEGWPCAMSWLRERGNQAPEGSPWCSAMSLPHVLRIVDDRLVVSHHPALERALPSNSALGDVPPGERLHTRIPGFTWRLRFVVAGWGAGGFAVRVSGDGQSFAVNAAGESLSVVAAGGELLLDMPAGGGDDAAEVDIVVDADIIEIAVSGTEGIGSTRIPAIGSGDICVVPLESSSLAGVRLSAHP